MKPQKVFLQVILLLISLSIKSQGFRVTSPTVDFDGTQLTIGYDIESESALDLFYIWLEIEKKNGESIRPKTLKGDIGENILSGKNKSITWLPGKDSVFLDEEIFVEVKAEKYVASFNRGSILLKSVLLPGLGQSKVKGKPYWITGIVAYGALAGGFVMMNSGKTDYNSYQVEENPAARQKLFEKAQNETNTAGLLLISGSVIWAANIIWIASIPNRYQPLKNGRISLERSSYGKAVLLALRLNF